MSLLRKVIGCIVFHCYLIIEIKSCINQIDRGWNTAGNTYIICFSVRDLQLLISLLRVLGRRRQHNVGASRATRARLLRQRHVLSVRRHLHHRLPQVLQTGHAAVLSRQTSVCIHHHIFAGLSLEKNVHPIFMLICVYVNCAYYQYIKRALFISWFCFCTRHDFVWW